jgi:hypothetical protein
MKKLPVLATIREAYGFVFLHLGAVIGLIWLPMILLTVTGFFVMKRFLEAMSGALASGNANALGSEALGPLFFAIASLLLIAMMSVPVTQLALGTRKQGALVHFSFSITEWRLFRSAVGLAGFLVLLFLTLGVATGLMQHSAGGPAAAARGTALLLVLFFAAMLYVAIRFAILLPALAVNENGSLLSRAWKLTAGNAGRIFLVVISAIMPVWLLSVIAQAVLEIALGHSELFSAGANPTGATLAEQVNILVLQLPLIWGVNFMVAPLFLGLLLGAGAAIYRALGDEKIA